MKLNKSGVVCILSGVDKTQGGKYGHEDFQADPTQDAEISPPDKREVCHNLDAEERVQDRREGRKAARRNPSSRAGLAFGAHQTKPSAEARFAGLTENCYATNQSQESTCLTMLRNECCVGYWKAGGKRVGCCYKMSDYGVRVI